MDVERERARRAARRAILGDAEAADPVHVGRFEIRSCLGAGATGIVYDAYDTDLRRPVALKVLRPAPGADPAASASRMRREAQALARVDHPHVVRVLELGEYQGNLYLVMERLDAVPLDRWIAAGREPAEILDCMLGAARGLAAAHAADLVHRDFKPANVLVDAAGHATVIDFGLVRAAEGAVMSGGLQVGLTDDGVRVGTPLYMSPEQVDGRIVDARSDQFSFCVVLYEALFGVHPFHGADGPAAIGGGTARQPVRSSPLLDRLGPALSRGMAPRRRDRFPTMLDLTVALERAGARPEPGSRLADRYVLRERIGAGGMGEVYRAFDERLRVEVAVKLLGSATSDVTRASERLVQEARAAAAINHPGIVRVLDVGTTTEGIPYYAMELVAGESLRELIDRRALTPTALVDVIGQAARALGAAHAAGLVHRDVKPDNLMVRPDGTAVLLDLGIVKVDPQRAVITAGPTTTDGTLMGTVSYLAPEQASGGAVSPATDQFALAVTAFEGLTGRPPWLGLPTEVIVQLVRDPPPLASALAPVPPNVDAVLARGMAKRPEDRFGTIEELAQALAGALVPPAPAPDRAPDKLPWMLAGLAALFLVGAAAAGVALAVLVWDRDDPVTPGHAADAPEPDAPGAPEPAPPPEPAGSWVPPDPNLGPMPNAADAVQSPGVLAQVGGDETEDVVALVGRPSAESMMAHLTAYDGATGERLWITPAFADTDEVGDFAVADGMVVAVGDAGQMFAHSMVTGAERWRGDVGGEAEWFCAAAGEALVVRVEGAGRVRVSLEDGSTSPDGGDECAPIPHSAASEWHRIQTDWTFDYYRRIRSGPSMSAEYAWRDEATDRVVMLGESRDGVRRVGYTAPGSEGWSAPIAEDGEAHDRIVGVLDGDALYLSYTTERGDARATAFGLADGQRRWHAPVELPGRGDIDAVRAGRSFVTVARDGGLAVLRRADGTTAFTVGDSAP